MEGNDPERAPTIADWQPWAVATTSSFRVDDSKGEVGLVQLTDVQFRVTTSFRYDDDQLIATLADGLVERGADPEKAPGTAKAALTFWAGGEGPTDLASIPRYLRWFENSYGRHTLAAIIHDELIVKEPNKGALGSDVAADFAFREMMRSAGVGFLKRWAMWTAVALRTRWEAGGRRRWSIVLWGLISLVGIAGFVYGVTQLFGEGDPTFVVGSIALGVAASGLWGRQYQAGIIAMITGFLLIPAGILAAIAETAFRATNRVFGSLGLR